MRPVEAELFHTDRQTDMTNAPKNVKLSLHLTKHCDIQTPGQVDERYPHS